MERIDKLEKELKNFDFLTVNKIINQPFYTLVDGATTALYNAYNYWEFSKQSLPIIFQCGLYQIIIEEEEGERTYTLQFVIR